MNRNPFSPQFGARPQNFIGREPIIEDFLGGLEFINNPNRTTILTGLRGSGKTALLSDIDQSVDKKRFVTVNVTAHDGMLAEIIGELNRNGKKWLSKSFSKIESVSVGVLGISFAVTKGKETETYGFRHTLTDILDALDKHRIGVVVMIDEVHNDTKEMQEFVIAYQHMVREERNIATLMAGLPGAVYDLMNNKILTFLRRSHRIFLHNIDIDLINALYAEIFAEFGKNPGDIIRTAARHTMGYPYLVQLLGYCLWGAIDKTITESKLQYCIKQTKEELFQNIHALVYNDLSPKDMEFVSAMCEDEGTSKFSDIMVRMNVDKSYASKYRQRLIDSGLVQSENRGELSFTLPYMREFVRSR